MKQLVVISGKGGTGKTSVVASLVHLAAATAPVVAADCDVDAANLALLMLGEDVCTEPFYAGQRAHIAGDLCDGCGLCVDACRFDAVRLDSLQQAQVDPVACEGCAVCALVCPTDAVSLSNNLAGRWMQRQTATGPLIHAALGIAQDNSGKLVARVRELGHIAAERDGIDLIVVDGPPGIGCPVHASVTGCDLALVVTEPTPSGEHDLRRVLELAAHFQLGVAVLINKYDVCLDGAARIESQAKAAGAPVVGKLPFAVEVPRALARCALPLEVPQLAEPLKRAWNRIRTLLDQAP